MSVYFDKENFGFYPSGIYGKPDNSSLQELSDEKYSDLLTAMSKDGVYALVDFGLVTKEHVDAFLSQFVAE